MYIAINVDDLQVLGLDQDYRVLCEIPGDDARIVAPADDARTYKDLTLGELRTLFRNHTGQDMPATDTPAGAAFAFIDFLKAQEGFIPTAAVATTVIRAVAPSQPAPTGKAPGARPKAGTSTGLVWDIADEEHAKHLAEGPIDWKALRGAVFSRATDAGVNPATVQVQFGKWKASK